MKCALGILRRTRELNEALHGLPEPIGVHVGVNSGVATVGATKIEGANGTRWTYTASGQVTIVAARLAAAGAKRTRSSWAPPPGSGWATEFPFDALGERALRNVEAPVRVFRLALPDGSLPPACRAGDRRDAVASARPPQPRPIDQNVGAEAVPRQAPLVGPIGIGVNRRLTA